MVQHIGDYPSSDSSLYRYIDTRLWERMQKLCPTLKDICDYAGYPATHPACLTDFMFVSVIASFANPTRREILRKLIMDVLADDLIALLDEPKEGGKA